jgi:extradiol dioxygenase family protein
MEKTIFHLALNVSNLEIACDFYGELLEAKQGRSTSSWVDFNFFGHQLSLHIGRVLHSEYTGKVDNTAVPMPHFGIILPLGLWQRMADKLIKANIEFIIPPTLRFEGCAGQQYTMFFMDPFGNPIEFKSFSDFNEVFNT